MRTAISGGDPEIVKKIKEAFGNPESLKSYSPDEIFSTDSHIASVEKLIWVYRTPWDTLLNARANHQLDNRLLQNWAEQNRRFSRKRRAFGKEIIVVNFDSFEPAVLATMIGVNGPKTPIVRPKIDEWSPILEKIFEDVAPSYLDVLEMLNALAQMHPTLHNFERSDSLKEDAPVRFVQLLKIADAGAEQKKEMERQLELLKKRASVEQEAVATNAEKLVKAKKELEYTQSLLAETNSKLITLEAESNKKQSDLSQRLASAERQVIQLKEKFRASESADALQMGKTARKELEEARTNILELLQQLHALQEEAERSNIEKKKIESEIVEHDRRRHRDAEQLRVEFEREKKNLVAELQEVQEAQKKFPEILQDIKARGQKELEELRADSELLVIQLHQVQLELENYFQDNGRLAGVLKSSTESSKYACELVAQLLSGTNSKKHASAI